MANLKVNDVVTLCEAIYEMIDELPERAEEFGDSVKNKTLDIQKTIEDRNAATPAQVQALENMKAGLERWIH
jgi:hypothetical protein